MTNQQRVRGAIVPLCPRFAGRGGIVLMRDELLAESIFERAVLQVIAVRLTKRGRPESADPMPQNRKLTPKLSAPSSDFSRETYG